MKTITKNQTEIMELKNKMNEIFEKVQYRVSRTDLMRQKIESIN